MMRLSCLILALAVCSEGVVLRGSTESLEVSADWAALSEAESEDSSFLLSQLAATEADLLRLQQAVDAPAAPVVAAKKEVAAPAKKEEAKAAPKKEKEESPQEMLKSLGIPNMAAVKGLKGRMALAPMLAMLKGLYEDSKERIHTQNVREEKSKKWFAEKEGEHKKKIDTIEGKFKNHTLSEEFRTNETRDETRYFTYWSRCRERQHRQFHTNLKIQHAMMSKVKKMIDMYEKTLSTKPSDQQAAKKQLGAMTGMPEIVFLQDTVRSFCKDSLEQVRKEREELQQAASDGMQY